MIFSKKNFYIDNVTAVNNIHSSSQVPPQHTSTPTSQSVPHHNLHSQISHQTQQQSTHQSPTVQQAPLIPLTHQSMSHAQTIYHQVNANSSLCSNGGNVSNMSEKVQLQNIPLPSSIYASTVSGNLHTPQSSIYQNPHSIENGLMPHHQHARVMTVMSTAGNMR